jgi:hypothetical protein
LKIVKESIVPLHVVSVSVSEPVLSKHNLLVVVAFVLPLLIGFLANLRNVKHLVSGASTVVGVNALHVVFLMLASHTTDLQSFCLEIPLFVAVMNAFSTSLVLWFHALLIALSLTGQLVLAPSLVVLVLRENHALL